MTHIKYLVSKKVGLVRVRRCNQDDVCGLTAERGFVYNEGSSSPASGTVVQGLISALCLLKVKLSPLHRAKGCTLESGLKTVVATFIISAS